MAPEDILILVLLSSASVQTAALATPSGRSPLGLLEFSSSVVPTQPLLVRTAKTLSRAVWELMVSELAPQDKDGGYARPADPFRSVESFAPRAVDTSASTPIAHVYTGNPCPWCHRVSLALAARRVPESVVQLTYLEDNPLKATRGGWAFAEDRPDPLFEQKDLRGVYDKLQPGFVGRCTAPLGVDAVSKQPISNESNDLMKFVNSLDVGAFVDESGQTWEVELRPPELLQELDEWIPLLYSGLNNGVYRCGFSTSQQAYDKAAENVADTLDRVEARLSKTRFLLGDKITEADIRLFPTIIRYDGAYSTVFKCGYRRIQSLPNLSGWMKDMYQSFARDTIDIQDAVASYYKWLIPLNPSGIIPKLPDPKLEEPHGRGPASPIFHLRKSKVVQAAKEAVVV